MSTELLRVLGAEALEALCERWGGADLTLPQRPEGTTFDALARALGQPAAAALVAWGGGCAIYVPQLDHARRERRRQEVQALRARGLTLAEIARTYRYEGRYTERQIRSLLRREG